MIIQENMEEVLNFSGENCSKYMNIINPFVTLNEQINKSKGEFLFNEHIDLANEFINAQSKINNYLDLEKKGLNSLNNKIKEYINNYDPSKKIIQFQWSNPSKELKQNFKEIIEVCAILLQSVSRLCLKINNQSYQGTNLVKEYWKSLNKWFDKDKILLEYIDNVLSWTNLVKEMRNEASWHTWWDKNWRKRDFYETKISFEKNMPEIQNCYFEFTSSKGETICIDNFKLFLNTTIENIYNISLEFLTLAYSKKNSIPYNFLKSFLINHFMKWNTINRINHNI